MTALPRASRARKGERLRGKSYSYREGDTRKQHSHDCLPTFRCVHNPATLSFILYARHGMVFSLAFSDARPSLPAAVVR
jgi:hypothetical protein